MRYTYKMVQIPPKIEVKKKDYSGNEAASYLESLVNEWAQQGWEFYRVDSIGVRVAPGCLAGASGAKNAEAVFYVVTFRRPA